MPPPKDPERYAIWKAKQDLTRPRGVPKLTPEQELRRRKSLSSAMKGKKHTIPHSTKGKTLVEIHGEERAKQITEANINAHLNRSSGMKGKVAWNKGVPISSHIKEVYSKARLKSILLGRFNPQKNRFKAINKIIGSSKGGIIHCQGRWELDFVSYLDSNSNVASFEKDKVRLSYNYEGKERVYIVDFLVKLYSGQKKLIEIKPSDMLKKDENPIKFATAEKWCSENNIEFLIITEKDLESIKKGYCIL